MPNSCKTGSAKHTTMTDTTQDTKTTKLPVFTNTPVSVNSRGQCMSVGKGISESVALKMPKLGGNDGKQNFLISFSVLVSESSLLEQGRHPIKSRITKAISLYPNCVASLRDRTLEIQITCENLWTVRHAFRRPTNAQEPTCKVVYRPRAGKW